MYQLEIARPSLIIAHPENLDITLKAAEKIKLSNDQVLTIDTISEGKSPVVSIPALIRREGSCPKFTHFKLGPGEAKKAIAFLCFSSGTTGKPKVRTLQTNRAPHPVNTTEFAGCRHIPL
ncbi:MAG TPA: hypothetical protein VGO47_03225 [Chlamydiales bacterium]|nr:hypothetical protein [Chlamydiales bacterium]